MGIAVHSGTWWPSLKIASLAFNSHVSVLTKLIEVHLKYKCLYRDKLFTEEDECYFTKLKLINKL